MWHFFLFELHFCGFNQEIRPHWVWQKGLFLSQWWTNSLSHIYVTKVTKPPRITICRRGQTEFIDFFFKAFQWLSLMFIFITCVPMEIQHPILNNGFIHSAKQDTHKPNINLIHCPLMYRSMAISLTSCGNKGQTSRHLIWNTVCYQRLKIESFNVWLWHEVHEMTCLIKLTNVVFFHSKPFETERCFGFHMAILVSIELNSNLA